MTCKPSLALLLALASAGCGGGQDRADGRSWRAMLERGDGVGAEAALRRELKDGAPEAVLAPFLGESALLQGDTEEARHWLTPAQFAPGVAVHGFRMLGRLRIDEGDLPAAGKAFDRALTLAPRDPDLWVDIGRLRWRGGEQAQAVEASQRALALGPKSPAALLFRAQLVRDAEGHAAALPLIERGIAAAPDHQELLGEYAATLGELGRAREMLAAVRRLPAAPRTYYVQAVLAARAGQYDLARSLLQRSGELAREVPGAILLLGLIDLEEGLSESAAQSFERVLRRQPENRRARLLLASALARGGNHRELIARFEDHADEPYLALLVGRGYEALGDRVRAAPYLDRAMARHSPWLLALDARTPLEVAKPRGLDKAGDAVAAVRNLTTAGRASEARSLANSFLAKHPGSGDAMALAGDAALAAGDEQGALGHYRAAAAIRRPWHLTKRMVFALDRLGNAAAATVLIDQHLSGEPANAEARNWLARRSTS